MVTRRTLRRTHLFHDAHLLSSARALTDRRRHATRFLRAPLPERALVRGELQRQRDSMLYERIGLSENRDEVLALAREGALADSTAGQLRDPYVFEFLGIERRAAMTESDIERALVDDLQSFLFELGRDFCFIARQFRITAKQATLTGVKIEADSGDDPF